MGVLLLDAQVLPPYGGDVVFHGKTILLEGNDKGKKPNLKGQKSKPQIKSKKIFKETIPAKAGIQRTASPSMGEERERVRERSL